MHLQLIHTHLYEHAYFTYNYAHACMSHRSQLSAEILRTKANMEREPASEIITGAGSPSPRLDARSFHKRRAMRKKERKTCSIRGKEESKKRKESKDENKEESKTVNKPNEAAKAEDETDSKEKTEANVKDDASRSVEAENQAEVSSLSSSHLGAWESMPPLSS